MWSKVRLFWLMGAVFSIVLVSWACNADVPNEVSTILPPMTEDTATKIALPDPTEIAATAPEVIATPQPNDPPAPATGPSPEPVFVTQLSFEPGATDLSFQGEALPGYAFEHTLRAAEGQIMQVSIMPPLSGLVLSVTGADGTVLQSAEKGSEIWRGHLPSSQLYTLSVSGAQEITNYSISVRIPAPIPQEAGSNTATVSGVLAAEGITQLVRYSILGNQGQTMTVTVTSPNNEVILSVTGFEDGQPYVRTVAGQTTRTLTLPATQDYIIGVFNSGAVPRSFTLTVQFTN